MGILVKKRCSVFMRSTLRKLYLDQLENGNIVIVMYEIDRESLSIIKHDPLFFLDETLQMVCHIYFKEFLENSGVRVTSEKGKFNGRRPQRR